MQSKQNIYVPPALKSSFFDPYLRITTEKHKLYVKKKKDIALICFDELFSRTL